MSNYFDHLFSHNVHLSFVLICLLATKQTTSSAPTTDPTKYNVPEYYEHSSYSFYDLDMTMVKHRLPQPSKFDPLVPKN